MLIALAKQKILTLIHFGGALINFIANFIFIPRYSYYGAAFNTLFTQLLVTIMMGIVLILAKQPLPTFKNAHKYLLAASMMILPLYFLQQLNFFLLLMIAFCIYFGILWLVKGLPLKALKAMYSNTNKTENSI
jgi:O-antigen/teichoic acid export membrane protein